ncbi:unnamed protein product [Protopolystoma xenopodis]|uniref:Dynein regulatory complex protein 12 n=1 Tax=Protopolystoma xenopodis TaxID=117903 RepID=A0A448WU39_9PLAT|nr:unnamed protein product [Protopolystoma xenopodis]
MQKTDRKIRPEDVATQLREEVGSLVRKVTSLNMHSRNYRLQAETRHEELDLANHKAQKAEADRTYREMEAKLATSCINTQYKVLQRMYILRVREAEEEVVKLKRKFESMSELARNEVATRDRLITEKDAKIEQLQAHMNSLHYQLEHVVYKMVERLEVRLQEDWTVWAENAKDYHNNAKKILMDLGIGLSFI